MKGVKIRLYESSVCELQLSLAVIPCRNPGTHPPSLPMGDRERKGTLTRGTHTHVRNPSHHQQILIQHLLYSGIPFAQIKTLATVSYKNPAAGDLKPKDS